ncbi:MAG: Spx/MgsR family RNA polymerase-binding regulatory protein [Gammaproteobacteria bacterium]|nr:Spx/MgsR family RNA polymerase-binding regulatory protein [Gammaproteobacteria bacterium]MCP4928328.1 Spx/MgsR family RNA polymerase-binding regulatory protein [Gammaproteobacteria bacterium]
MLTLYGIPNCDKCRAAKNWFSAHGFEFRFHDLRSDGLSTTLVDKWLRQVGYKTLINTRSKTWRNLPDTSRKQLNDSTAWKLVLEYPTLINRPLVVSGSALMVGYDTDAWAKLS